MRTQTNQLFDPRHLLPMGTEFLSLCASSLRNRKSRQQLVGVGRSIRDAHFQAKDQFRSMNLREIVQRIAHADCRNPVQLPAALDLVGNTIGGVIPYFYIGALAAAKRPQLTVEIGTYLGASALTVAFNSPGDVYTVDLPDAVNTETLSAGDKALVNKAMSGVGSAFQGHPISSRIHQIRADSSVMDIREYIGPDQVDFFIVDGGHSLDCVSKDTQTAFECIADDGLIFWDDYNWIFPELRSFLQGLAKSRPMVRIEGTQYVIFHRSLA